MTNEYLSFLAELYNNSVALVAIYDMNYNLVFKNKALKKIPKNSEYDQLNQLLGKEPTNNDLYYFQIGEKINTLNVIIMKNKGYIIAEQISSQDISDVFAVPVVDDYLTYIFSKIREMANTVSISIEEIYKDLIKLKSEGNTTNVDYFNTIDDCILELLDEIIDPEILLNLAKNNNNDRTMCVSEVVNELADEAQHLLNNDVIVYKNIENGIYTRLNKSYFDVIISDITNNLLYTGNMPSSLIYSVMRIDDNNLRISVEAEGRNFEIDESNSSTVLILNKLI